MSTSSMTKDEGYQEAERRIDEARRTGAEELRLNFLGLDALPDEVWQLTRLRVLHIADNRLMALPPALMQLRRLNKLHVGNNRFTALPETLGALPELQKIYASSNLLTGLPETLGKLQLLCLSVRNNRLTALPEALEHMKSLQVLYLHGNPALGLSPDILGPDLEEVQAGKTPAAPCAILSYYFGKRKLPAVQRPPA